MDSSTPKGKDMELKIMRAFIILMVIVLSGCSSRQENKIPSELIGVWQTSSSRCKNCSFEIKEGSIIFTTGPEYIDVNQVLKIEQSGKGEKGEILYDIHYKNREGGKFVLSLFFFPSEEGGVIRYKNQSNITWSKKTA
jgi:hypothetical protein